MNINEIKDTLLQKNLTNEQTRLVYQLIREIQNEKLIAVTDIPAKGSTLYVPTINMQANAITSADIEKATVTNVETTHDGIEITANQRRYTANEIGTKIFIKETDAIACFDKMCNFKARHRNIANHIAHTPIVIGEQITFAFQSELKNDINFMVQCHILKETINKNCTGYNITELGEKWLAWFK